MKKAILICLLLSGCIGVRRSNLDYTVIGFSLNMGIGGPAIDIGYIETKGSSEKQTITQTPK